MNELSFENLENAIEISGLTKKYDGFTIDIILPQRKNSVIKKQNMAIQICS